MSWNRKTSRKDWPMGAITAAQLCELGSLIDELRRIAEPVGPLHAYWDLISHAEDSLEGRRPRMFEAPQEAIDECNRTLGRMP